MAHPGRSLAGPHVDRQAQRTAIAQALAIAPRCCWPTSRPGNLDSETGAEILDLFNRLHREQGLTLVVITHARESPSEHSESSKSATVTSYPTGI